MSPDNSLEAVEEHDAKGFDSGLVEVLERALNGVDDGEGLEGLRGEKVGLVFEDLENEGLALDKTEGGGAEVVENVEIFPGDETLECTNHLGRILDVLLEGKWNCKKTSSNFEVSYTVFRVDS